MSGWTKPRTSSLPRIAAARSRSAIPPDVGHGDLRERGHAHRGRVGAEHRDRAGDRDRGVAHAFEPGRQARPDLFGGDVGEQLSVGGRGREAAPPEFVERRPQHEVAAAGHLGAALHERVLGGPEHGLDDGRHRVRREPGEPQAVGAVERGEFAEQVAGLGQFFRTPGHHEQNRPLFEVAGEPDEPLQRLGVRPVGVVDQQDDRAVPLGEPGHEPVERVAHTERVRAGSGRRGAQADGRGDDVVPVAQEFAAFVVGAAGEQVEEQLPDDGEGPGLFPLAALGPQHGAVAGHGDSAGFVEDGGLAPARLALHHEEFARERGGAARVGVFAQGLDDAADRAHLAVALQQLRARRRERFRAIPAGDADGRGAAHVEGACAVGTPRKRSRRERVRRLLRRWSGRSSGQGTRRAVHFCHTGTFPTRVHASAEGGRWDAFASPILAYEGHPMCPP